VPVRFFFFFFFSFWVLFFVVRYTLCLSLMLVVFLTFFLPRSRPRRSVSSARERRSVPLFRLMDFRFRPPALRVRGVFLQILSFRVFSHWSSVSGPAAPFTNEGSPFLSFSQGPVPPPFASTIFFAMVGARFFPKCFSFYLVSVPPAFRGCNLSLLLKFVRPKMFWGSVPSLALVFPSPPPLFSHAPLGWR